MSTFVTVIVSVIDINDNQPLILSSDAIKLPSSDIRLNEPFTKIVAMDKDEGENGRLTYSILRYGILLQKLFWPTVRKNCSSDREKLLKFEAEGR